MNFPLIYKEKDKNWKIEIQNSIRTIEELIDFFSVEQFKNSPFSYILDSDYKENFKNINKHFRFQVTPYYLSLANIQNKTCPILLQILPDKREILDSHFLDLDPLKEEDNSPVPNLIHRYPDRVLWYISHHCAVYCRFCMRKRKVSNPSSNTIHKFYTSIIQYIKKHSTIKEVILSGGDPLSLEDSLIEKILSDLKQINHLYSIRIHTRMITTLPYRITDKLVQIFDKYYPLTIVTHFNHPIEITSIVKEKIKLLKKSGVTVLNQSVLLKNINDSLPVMEKLCLELIKAGIKPYYLHHCDEVYGTSHFRVSMKKGIELMQQLRGRNPGIAIPLFVVDLPGGGGKVPIQPEYLLKFDPEEKIYYFYNYEFKNIYKIYEI